MAKKNPEVATLSVQASIWSLSPKGHRERERERCLSSIRREGKSKIIMEVCGGAESTTTQEGGRENSKEGKTVLQPRSKAAGSGMIPRQTSESLSY
jgi:hypothetical protein